MHCKQFNTARAYVNEHWMAIVYYTVRSCRSNCDFEFVLSSIYIYIPYTRICLHIHMDVWYTNTANLSMRELFYIEFFRILNFIERRRKKKLLYNCDDDDNVRTNDDGHTNIHTCDQRENRRKTTTAQRNSNNNEEK